MGAVLVKDETVLADKTEEVLGSHAAESRSLAGEEIEQADEAAAGINAAPRGELVVTAPVTPAR